MVESDTRKLLADIEQTVSEWQQETIQKFNNTMETLHLDTTKLLATMKSNFSSWKKETLQSVTQITRSLQSATEQRLEVMERNMSTLFNVTAVAFNARKAVEKSPEKGKIVKFEHTLLNLGGSYNESTSIFTAPANGTYLFGAQVCSNKNKYGTFQIVVDAKENVILVIADYEKESEYTSSSGSVVSYLNAGQIVWVNNQFASTDLYDHDSECWNQFFGMLIHESF